MGFRSEWGSCFLNNILSSGNAAVRSHRSISEHSGALVFWHTGHSQVKVTKNYLIGFSEVNKGRFIPRLNNYHLQTCRFTSQFGLPGIILKSSERYSWCQFFFSQTWIDGCTLFSVPAGSCCLGVPEQKRCRPLYSSVTVGLYSCCC